MFAMRHVRNSTKTGNNANVSSQSKHGVHETIQTVHNRVATTQRTNWQIAPRHDHDDNVAFGIGSSSSKCIVDNITSDEATCQFALYASVVISNILHLLLEFFSFFNISNGR